MVSRKKSKNKKWVCTECKDWEKNPVVCVHLEKLIKSESGQSVRAVQVKDIDKINPQDYTLVIPAKVADGSYERQFKEKLRAYGLHPLQIEILVRRFFYEYTLKEITEELDIASVRTTYNLMSKALKELKARGMK